MKHEWFLGSAFFFLLSGCMNEDQSAAAGHAQSSAQPAKEAIVAAACPYADFASFLSGFSEDNEVQAASTLLPLEVQSVDPAAEPEPALISTALTVNQLEFPVFPTRARQLEEGLATRQATVEDGDIKVTTYKQDTDYQKSYFFRKDPCWKLVRIRDESL